MLSLVDLINTRACGGARERIHARGLGVVVRGGEVRAPTRMAVREALGHGIVLPEKRLK